MRRLSTGYKNSYEWMMFKEIQILLKDNDLFDLNIEERAQEGIFLAFQFVE